MEPNRKKKIKELLGKAKPIGNDRSLQKICGDGNHIQISNMSGDIIIANKKKKRPLKTVAVFCAALFIAITIILQADPFEKNQGMSAAAPSNKKKIFNKYTTDANLPHYLNEVYSTFASPELSSNTKSGKP